MTLVATEYVENLIHEVIEKLVHDQADQENNDPSDPLPVVVKETRPVLADKTNQSSSDFAALEKKLVEYQKTEYAMSAVSEMNISTTCCFDQLIL